MSLEKRPKDMTNEEIVALPLGPFIRKRRAATLGEAAWTGARWIEWAEYPEEVALSMEADDLAVWFDNSGNAYGFGQWASGGWFRRPH